MSSARRYQEDIRRIVGLQENGIGLEDDLPRMRIRGQRGIYQIGTDEVKSGAAAGSEDETETDESQEPEMPDESEEENGNEDGSGQGGGNTDSTATDGDDYQTDPDNPPPNTDTSSDAFGGNWASGGASDFVDCETDQCIQVVEGQAGYVPPDGWEDADVPTIDPDYEDGYYWYMRVSGQVTNRIEGLSPQSVINQWWACCSEEAVPCSGGANYIKINNTLFRPYRQGFNMEGEPTSCLATGPNVDRAICTGQSICEEPPPAPTHWPADNCIQLAPNSEGNWAASNRENPNDMTAKYSEPKSQLDLCTPSGENVQIFKGKDGGNVRWNVNQQRWAASGPDGRYTRFGSSSSVQEQLAPNAGTPKAPPQN